MTHVLSLGAINKLNGEYVYPKIANKKDKYICPDCNKDLILCQGEIIRPYFRHKVDSVNPCHRYNNPTETQIHKDGKMVMKALLERKIPISFIRNCCSCKKNEEYEIPEMTESSKIELEYRFEYNGTKIADVAYLDNDDILCMFEICNTHKTRSENRPEPWFEIDANSLLMSVNTNNEPFTISCIRCEKCDDCIYKERELELERKLKIRNEVERKSSNNESDSYGCYSESIMMTLIDIICGDDAYKQWSSAYRPEDGWNFSSEENKKIGYNYNVCRDTYYNEDLIREIQNINLYKYLNRLSVSRGNIELELAGLYDTDDVEDKVKKLCKELFESDEDAVSVSWVPWDGGDQLYNDNDCFHCNGTGYFKGDDCWFC